MPARPAMSQIRQLTLAWPCFAHRLYRQCIEIFLQAGRLAVNVVNDNPYNLIVFNFVRRANARSIFEKALDQYQAATASTCVAFSRCYEIATPRHYDICWVLIDPLRTCQICAWHCRHNEDDAAQHRKLT